ncbi:hypothetical protein BDD12DRAFT_810995 [Trichophaea hybrida]|nr:hypothetical protein BDD12DRAFT_810995 [Trichophaea hybrida]
MHIDRELSTIMFPVGGRKHWLLWDPTDPSYSTVKAYYDDWVNQASTPQQPDGTTGLYIPAGWYNVMFTLKGGFLTGYMMPSTQKVEALVRNVEAECNVTPQEPKMSKLLWDDIFVNVPIILETIIQLAKDKHDAESALACVDFFGRVNICLSKFPEIKRKYGIIYNVCLEEINNLKKKKMVLKGASVS